jgi:phosphodiesterase/alkaline phosphatase D-like protein
VEVFASEGMLIVLAALVCLTGTTSASSIDACFDAPESSCFLQGVASADPTSDGFILWTRLDPKCCKHTESCEVRWAVRDATSDVISQGTATAGVVQRLAPSVLNYQLLRALYSRA